MASIIKEGVYIIGAKRTPIGSFLGALSSLAPPKLGSFALKGALDQSNLLNIKPDLIEACIMGNVMSAGIGQNPARQSLLGISDLPNSPPQSYFHNITSTNVNKVCASSMKAAMYGSMMTSLYPDKAFLVGGFESMSQCPLLFPAIPGVRVGTKFGDQTLKDCMIIDGLTDPYCGDMMGHIADRIAKTNNISRQEQDNFAIESYRRAEKATSSGIFAKEIIPVTVSKGKKGTKTITEDEEYKNVILDKIPKLPPAFVKGKDYSSKGYSGSITAANASKLSDGGSALVICSGKFLLEHGLGKNSEVLCRIAGYADAERIPEEFPLAPVDAAYKAIYHQAGLSIKDIDCYEINEAFSTVPLLFMKHYNIDHSIVNIHGGAVALGHPLGNSGSRIMVSLINALKHKNAKYGCAAICNGGGGASAIVLENISKL